MHEVTVSGVIGAVPAGTSSSAGPLPVPQRGFISSEPGETWEQGLIAGNGTIGANVFGQPLDETVILTHERLFIPLGAPTMPPPNGQRLFELRNLIDRGLYKQATQLAFDLSGQEDFLYHDHFVPAFDLNIRMEGEHEPKDYMRSLDFQTGQAIVQWSDEQGVYQRRSFVSRADGVAVMQIVGPGKGSVNCRLKLKVRDPHPKLVGGGHSSQAERSAKMFKHYVSDTKITAEPTTLMIRQDFAHAYPGSIHAMEGVARIVPTNGKMTPEGDDLVVTDADQVLVYVDVEMVYDPDHTVMVQIKDQLSGLPADYDTLLGRHAPIHGDLFMRMRLDIGGGADHNLATEELLAKTSNQNLNRALVEKEFDAGRYNILSCTGELPPNLQGVWAGTYVPDWASDYTHNGNVPSAIASMLMGNMPELMLAYTSYIESIVPYLEINARNMFGARGIVLPSRSTTTGFNNALNQRFAGGFWVAGAAWAARFFYDYYLYTGDRAFLVDHALPFMEKAALFFEDYLYEGPDGKYVFNPTQSPENTPGNTDSQGSFNATMDVAAAKELLHNLIEACRETGRNQEKVARWQGMLEKMPAYMTNDDGIIKEWLTPRLDNRDSHRHSSQLYPLYDGMPEEIAGSPELQAAFKMSIEYKLAKHWTDNQRGFMSFGLVQLGQAATSLGERDLAYECLVHLANRFWLSNLASMHNHKALFNMDISGGMPAVIIKMLVASEPGRITLFPALPQAWPTGTIEGVLCRGQIEIKRLQWSPDGISADLVSSGRQAITLELPADITSLSVRQGDAVVDDHDETNCCTLTLPAGQTVSLDISMEESGR